MTGIKLIGTGMYIPETVATNEDFTKIVDTSDEWITKRTGIKERHPSNGEPTWYMGVQAAKQAMEDAGVTPDGIDMVISTSVTGDYYTPSTANIMQGKLGIHKAFSIDINCACAGFVYGFDMAQRYIAMDDDVKTVLIISSENITKLVDYEDRSTCVLFGDGAGAAVVTAGPNRCYTYLECEAQDANKIYAQNARPGNAFTTQEGREKYLDLFPQGREHYMHMDGRDVYKFATRAMPEGLHKACEKAGIKVEDLALIIPHQANYRIIETAAKNLGLSMDHFYLNIDRYGNISSACIPVCLNELKRAGRLKEGDKIALVGFGAGLVYGATVFTI